MTLSLIIFYQWNKKFSQKIFITEVLWGFKYASESALKCFHSQKQHRRCSTKKAILENFAIFTGKHLYWSLFLIDIYFEEHFRTTASSFSSTFSFSCYFNSFMTEISIIYKPVHWFAEQNLYDRDLRHERVKWKWINQSKVIPTFETNLASLGVITVSNRHLSALIFPGFLCVHLLLATSFPDRDHLVRSSLRDIL